MKKLVPFLWMFQNNEPRKRDATSGEDMLTESVNEETSAAIIETIYNKLGEMKNVDK